MICLGCCSGSEVAGGELRGQTMKGHLCGIASAPYPVGSEIPLKGFEQECNMPDLGFGKSAVCSMDLAKGRLRQGNQW